MPATAPTDRLDAAEEAEGGIYKDPSGLTISGGPTLDDDMNWEKKSQNSRRDEVFSTHQSSWTLISCENIKRHKVTEEEGGGGGFTGGGGFISLGPLAPFIIRQIIYKLVELRSSLPLKAKILLS